MGFSSALQGRAAHEALIVRQDAELRLMDTMKRSIQMKAKCDREYAIGLAAAAQQGLKIDRADEMHGSLITKSWRSFMDELDQQAKQFKSNAELLEVVCEKLTHLSQDKRKARKAYQEEHAKIAARLNHLTDEVVRKKTEYQKHLEGYKALRTRFEEYYIKSGRGGRKLDDVRDKYQKACRKLHLTHNEYVLSITEAIEVEKDFRTVLLPGLLEHQQSVQESFILLWKNILQEASQHSDLTSDKFKEIQKRIDNVINNINPSEEYREFTEKHKTSPTIPLVFQFDDSLIEDIPGKLQSNTLTVDNLTVDWLRSRLIDLEMSVKESQEKQVKMIEHVNGGSPIANGSITTNGSTSSSNGIQSNKDCQNRQSKDLNALRCQEKQKQKLVDMIKCALNEIGCEELPSGCDDHLEQNFIESSFNNDQQNSSASTNSASVSIMNELMRRGGVLTLLRGRHFKRKSTPQPTTPTANRTRTQRFTKLQPRSQSLGSLSVNNSPAKYEPITNLMRMAASVEASTSYGLHDMDPDSVIMFERGAASKMFPKLRRTQHSMLCLNEEPPTAFVISIYTNANTNNTNNNTNKSNNNNNNNIYADLDRSYELGPGADCDSVKSGELALRQQENVEIEINRVDSSKAAAHEKQINEQQQTPIVKKTTPTKLIKTVTPSSGPDDSHDNVMKNSIDAHLDRIDELNRALDDRLKRHFPATAASTSTHVDLDAIEAATEAGAAVNAHKKPAQEEETQSTSKRSSSSSSDCRTSCKPQTNGNSKKRSVSFSQKSINAILTNIKEFSKSPLQRMQKANNHITLLEYKENRDLFELLEPELAKETTENEVNQNPAKKAETPLKSQKQKQTPSKKLANSSNKSSMNANNIGGCTDSGDTETSNAVAINPSKDTSAPTSSKLKFKVPKIQKKSKAIRNTFRSKLLDFQIKRGKLCKKCTKRRRIHPSRGVFDFTKEFSSSHDGRSCGGGGGGVGNGCTSGSISGDDSDDFCHCPPDNSTQNFANNEAPTGESTSSADAEDECNSDDMLSIKEHCYCVPSLAMSVSSVSSSDTIATQQTIT